jgi:hypothetical protein
MVYLTFLIGDRTTLAQYDFGRFGALCFFFFQFFRLLTFKTRFMFKILFLEHHYIALEHSDFGMDSCYLFFMCTCTVVEADAHGLPIVPFLFR